MQRYNDTCVYIYADTIKTHEKSVAHTTAVGLSKDKADFADQGGWAATLAKVKSEQRKVILHNMLPVVWFVFGVVLRQFFARSASYTSIRPCVPSYSCRLILSLCAVHSLRVVLWSRALHHDLVFCCRAASEAIPPSKVASLKSMIRLFPGTLSNQNFTYDSNTTTNEMILVRS